MIWHCKRVNPVLKIVTRVFVHPIIQLHAQLKGSNYAAYILDDNVSASFYQMDPMGILVGHPILCFGLATLLYWFWCLYINSSVAHKVRGLQCLVYGHT